MAYIERNKTDTKAAQEAEVKSNAELLEHMYGKPYRGDDE